MGADPAVKTFFPVHYAGGDYGAFLPEEIDVAVHGSQGQGRDGRFKFVVNPLRAGMGLGGPYGF
jgi:hypothetical protein